MSSGFFCAGCCWAKAAQNGRNRMRPARRCSFQRISTPLENFEMRYGNLFAADCPEEKWHRLQSVGFCNRAQTARASQDHMEIHRLKSVPLKSVPPNGGRKITSR